MELTHTHNHGHGLSIDEALKGRLRLSATLTGIIFFTELIGGFLTNSLALLSDAAHVFMDVFALSLSWFALYVSGLPPTETRTYGLHRVEVFVSLVNGLVLALISIYIFYKAYFRILFPQEVGTLGMFAVASVGLVVNLIVALWLKNYAASDLNIKSAFFHVIGDAASSVGVIAGAVIIYFTGWYAADPIISILIGFIILAGSFRIMEESSHILLEGVPREVDLNRVVSDIRSVEGVSGVHSLHIWSICHNIHALSAHVDVEVSHRAKLAEVLDSVNEKLAGGHHIFYTTLQAECSSCNSNDIFRTIAHRERKHLH